MLKRPLFLTILCLLGFLAAAIGYEWTGRTGSRQRVEGPPVASGRHDDSVLDERSGDSAKDAGPPPMDEMGEGSRDHMELKERLNNLYKYRALGYLSPLLWPGDPSELRTGIRAAHSMMQSDHRLFSNARWDGLADGPSSSAAVRRSLDFKALDAMSRTGAGRNGSGSLQSRSQLHRRPIEPPPPSFSAQQGLLGFPLSGQFESFSVGKLGPGTESILHNGGLFVKAPQGEPIRSIFRGTVIFAEWFKEYGRVMIIDHGEHYCSLIAHADRLLKGVNDAVDSGEVIATVGRTGALKVPGLYFEIRHHGSPVDPLEWLKADTTSRE